MQLDKKAINRYQSKIDYINFNAYEKMTPWQRKKLYEAKSRINKKATISKDQMDHIDNMYETARRHAFSMR